MHRDGDSFDTGSKNSDTVILEAKITLFLPENGSETIIKIFFKKTRSSQVYFDISTCQWQAQTSTN